jgi:ribosomal protein S18 acetylase RimI-like enzyme
VGAHRQGRRTARGGGPLTRSPRRGAVRLRRVDHYDEPAFGRLVDATFDDAARQRHLDALMGEPPAQAHRDLRKSLPAPERIRIAAHDGDRFVGYSHGWFEVGGRFYIGSSAVHPDYRRRGVYTRLLRAVEKAVRERGGIAISSHHVATNNPVLIAKLKLGYVIAGVEFIEPMGLLVRLVHYLEPSRAALYRERTGMLAAPAAPTRSQAPRTRRK